MSLLANMEDTLNTGTLISIKDKMFYKLYVDAKNIFWNNKTYQPTLSSYLKHCMEIISNNLKEIKLYELVDIFNLSAEEIEILCNSDYIDKMLENYVYHSDLGISFNANYIDAIKYLKNPEQFELNYSSYYTKYIKSNNKELHNISLNIFKKSVLNINLYFSDIFYTELKEFIKTRLGYRD